MKFSDKQLYPGRTGAKAYDGYPITPSDTLATYGAQIPAQNGQPIACDAIYITGAGAVAVVLDAAGNTAVITAAAGSLIPISFTQIMATGTTATGLYSLTRGS